MRHFLHALRLTTLCMVLPATLAAAGGRATFQVPDDIVAFVAQETGLAVPPRMPAIVFTPPEVAKAAPDWIETVAAYDTRTGNIHLSKSWTGGTAAELSVLVHELVHHFQTESGVRFACPGEREKVAYDVQARWLEAAGGDIERDFGMNRTFLLLATTCAPP